MIATGNTHQWNHSEISISKEILTITIGDDSYAKVDVYYEFYNSDTTKTILMGFEAAKLYILKK